MLRHFDNPRRLPLKTAQARIRSLDQDAIVALQVKTDDFGAPTLDSYIVVDSSATHDQIVAKLAAVSDPADADVPRQSAAHDTAKAIPNYFSWTQAQFTTWYNANISSTQINAATTVAQLKVIMLQMSVELQALGKMEIAMRDQVWPDFPD